MNARCISAVRGLAVGLGFALLAAPAPALAVTGPERIAFHTVRAGNDTESSIPFTVAEGEQVAAARLEGSERFELDSDDCEGSPPAGTCRVRVRFAPASAGNYTATLLVGDATVRLSAAAYSIGPSLEASRLVLSWLVRGREVSEPVDDVRSVNLVNRGDAPIMVTRLSITGRDAAYFSLESSFCAYRRLSPGERCEINVRLRSPGGARHARLQIATELPQAPYTLSLHNDAPVASDRGPICPCATNPNPRPTAPAWSFGITRARFVNGVSAEVYTSLSAKVTVTVFRGSRAVKTWNSSGRVTGLRAVNVRVALKRGGYRLRVVGRRSGGSRTSWDDLTVR